MAQDSTAAKNPSASADYDAVVDQLAALREDMAKLANAVSSGAQHRGRALANGLSERVTDAVDSVGRGGKSAETRFEGVVTSNPVVSIGVAVGVGMLMGALARR